MKWIRIAIIIIGLALAMYKFNTSIRALDTIKSEGQIVYIELRPVDPRAFMMGDYMTLGYHPDSLPKSRDIASEGIAVLRLDTKKIAKFARLDDGTSIAADEVRMRYAKTGWRLTYGGGRYYFQEGTADIYDEARYGVFKVGPSGYGILVGLADENQKRLEPKPNP